MILSDLAVRRPVMAGVMSLVILTLGVVGLTRLSMRELPDIESPRVSISTNYPGAAAAVVETRVTELIENEISGIDGIRTISSTTSDGRSSIDVEFVLERDLDAAANDIRDRVGRVLDRLPQEVDPPEIAKAQSGSDTVFWMNLASPGSMIHPETTTSRTVLSRALTNASPSLQIPASSKRPSRSSRCVSAA